MKRLSRALLAAAAGLALTLSAAAQDFPARPITLLVPFAAGGPSDSIARLVGQSLTATLGKQVVIENVAGSATAGVGGRAGRGCAAAHSTTSVAGGTQPSPEYGRTVL